MFSRAFVFNFGYFSTENLFPNVTMELYFLMQLLTSRGIDMELIAVYGEGRLERMEIHV